MTHNVTLITGDGCGPELSEAMRRCVDATGVDIAWDEQSAGLDVYEAEGDPLPPRVIESIQKNKVAIKAPITTPVGSGFRSVNVRLRKMLDLYACVRPCVTYKGVRSNFKDIDIAIIRENTEGLYIGIEFKEGTEEQSQLLDFVRKHKDASIKIDSGVSLKCISRRATERIVQYAFDYARTHGRKKVTSVHKANILKYSDGLWLEASREVAARNTDIEFEDRIVDNMCMQMVQKPELYDVLVMPNLFGDILSDLGAGLVGGLGVAPGGNIGDDCAVFEATHGSAPKYTGMNKVNPTALILSAVMMLEHMGEDRAAHRLRRAVAHVIAEGKDVTYDMKPHREDPTAVGTSQMADAIIAALSD